MIDKKPIVASLFLLSFLIRSSNCFDYDPTSEIDFWERSKESFQLFAIDHLVDYDELVKWIYFMKKGRCGRIKEDIVAEDLKPLSDRVIEVRPFQLLSMDNGQSSFLETVSITNLLQRADSEQMLRYILSFLLNWARFQIRRNQDGTLHATNRLLFKALPMPFDLFNLNLTLHVQGEISLILCHFVQVHNQNNLHAIY
jgi:hypothetical protein